MISFNCSKCGEVLEAPESLIGQVLKCPKCSLHEQVPNKSSLITDTSKVPPVSSVLPDTPRPLPSKPNIDGLGYKIWGIIFILSGIFCGIASKSALVSLISVVAGISIFALGRIIDVLGWIDFRLKKK